MGMKHITKPARATVMLIVAVCAAAFVVVSGNPADAWFGEQATAAYSDPAEALTLASEWLVKTHQNSDGGFTSFSTGANLAPSDVGGTVDAILAIAEAGGEVAGPIGYLADHLADVSAYAQEDGSASGKLILALVAAGENPADFGGSDYVAFLNGHLADEGHYDLDTAYGQALAVLGADAAGVDVPAGAADWLVAQQASEGELTGSWNDGFGTAGNADATALATVALLASGRQADDPPVEQAVTFLAGSQLPTSGWEYGPGLGENANSTALVIEALTALGYDVSSSGGRWAKGGRSPLIALLSWQAPSGAFQTDLGQGRSDDFYATVQSMPALAAAPSVSQQGPPAAGGDSPLPWILIGVVIVLVAGAALLYFRKPRT
jgi:hypothetical protein